MLSLKLLAESLTSRQKFVYVLVLDRVSVRYYVPVERSAGTPFLVKCKFGITENFRPETCKRE